MSAMTGIWLFLAMIGSASASSRDGTATRTMSQPEAVSSAICCSVALMFGVGVVHIDCTLICAPPPTSPFPTLICRDLRRGARVGTTFGNPRFTAGTWHTFFPSPRVRAGVAFAAPYLNSHAKRDGRRYRPAVEDIWPVAGVRILCDTVV